MGDEIAKSAVIYIPSGLNIAAQCPVARFAVPHAVPHAQLADYT